MPSEDYFVNPYTFLPLPTNVVRDEPTYHLGPESPDRPLYSGHIDVTWKLRTPLLLPENAEKEGWVTAVSGASGGATKYHIRIPGSSLKGSVRSLHEAMFNGCLRVLDEGYVPVHRQPASTASNAGYELAVVIEAEEVDVPTLGTISAPTRVRKCGKHEFVESLQLRAAYPKGAREPATGDVLSVKVTGARTAPGDRRAKWNLPARPDPASGNARNVTVVWSSEAREVTDGKVAGRDGGNPQSDVDPWAPGNYCFIVSEILPTRGPRAYWAVGRLSADTPRVDPDAVQRFARTAAGAEDYRRLRAADGDGLDDRYLTDASVEETTKDEDGEKVKTIHGWRRMATPSLFPGDVVWVKLSSGPTEKVVSSIKLAQIWREEHGGHPVRERIGTLDHSVTSLACQPQDSNDHVCLSCATFGTIDASRERSGHGQQDAYAGHVRFGSAISVDPECPAGGAPVELTSVRLAPMSSPRPTAGVFYLESPKGFPARDPRDGEGDVASHWDSAVEEGSPRPIRGRKFYWHADPDLQKKSRRLARARYEATDRQAERKSGDEMCRMALLVPAGTTLAASVFFDRLDEVALSSLVYAIDPKQFLPSGKGKGDVAVHLSGGKGLGLGSAIVDSCKVVATRTVARYVQKISAEAFTPVGPGDLVQRCGSMDHLVFLSKVQRLKGLGNQEMSVSYPPGARWSRVNDRDGAFRESYRFFGSASGLKYGRIRKGSNEGKPRSTTWEPLPLIESGPQEIHIQPTPRPPVQKHGSAEADSAP